MQVVPNSKQLPPLFSGAQLFELIIEWIEVPLGPKLILAWAAPLRAFTIF
jgi:hypothetical protein